MQLTADRDRKLCEAIAAMGDSLRAAQLRVLLNQTRADLAAARAALNRAQEAHERTRSMLEGKAVTR